LADGSGSRYQPGFGQPGGFYQPTTYTPAVPFPNDAQNFAGVGPEGLRVVATKSAFYTRSQGNSLSESWTAHKFNVQFDLDEPASYTYSRSIVDTDDSVAVINLQADGQPPIAVLPLFGERSGVLPAGHYTFSGGIEINGAAGSGQFATARGGYALSLTVAPEPAVLPILGGMMLCALCGRRRAMCARLPWGLAAR
jgi:hypothetical protein